jgi:HemY protein
LIKLGDHAALCAILAARAAHELREYARRDAYLAQAATLAPDDDAPRLVTEAELLLDERRYQEALDVLKALPRKHTAALRLELRAQQAARNWDQVLVLINQLEKRGVFDAEQAEQVRVRAHAENLKRKGLDGPALTEAWQKIPARQKKDTRVAAAAAQCFIALGTCAKAHEIIEQSLAENWDSVLVGLYAECENGDTLRRIERAETWLQTQPRDAVLLLALGRLCAKQGLWGKAQSYLEASIAIEPTHSALLALAQLEERLGHVEAARQHSRESLELAVGQLRQLTGGRRKSPL